MGLYLLMLSTHLTFCVTSRFSGLNDLDKLSVCLQPCVIYF